MPFMLCGAVNRCAGLLVVFVLGVFAGVLAAVYVLGGEGDSQVEVTRATIRAELAVCRKLNKVHESLHEAEELRQEYERRGFRTEN